MTGEAKSWLQVAEEVAATSVGEGQNPAVSGVEYDSRRVTPGSIFVAMRGGSTDGNRYIEAALRQGAAGVITDSREAFAKLRTDDFNTPALLAEHGRTALAQASAAFFDHPEQKLKSTGITGTNGKTTTAFLTEALLNAASRSTVLVGTIEYHVAGAIRPSAHTTPESRDLFELMAEGASLGATELVMEVSSHALDQGRIAGIGFDVAVFTNLTRDHLDYHGTMEAYLASKRLLFDGTRYPAPRIAIVYKDDEHSSGIAEAALQGGSRVQTYAIGEAADWTARELRLAASGAEFNLVSRFGSARVRSALAGEVNVLNLLAAVAAAHARGVSFDQVIQSIPSLKPVPGRFQPVDAGQPFTVIVDYAHTDDALRNLISLARQLVSSNGRNGRVITLFGCGGDRDLSKRPKMGQAAGEGSDFVVVTSDNPRSEDPDDIIAEILPGVLGTGVAYTIHSDRAFAVQTAVAEAQPGDVVLIAGKGHEKVQILREGPIFFDDTEAALSSLASLGYGGEL